MFLEVVGILLTAIIKMTSYPRKNSQLSCMAVFISASFGLENKEGRAVVGSFGPDSSAKKA